MKMRALNPSLVPIFIFLLFTYGNSEEEVSSALRQNHKQVRTVALVGASVGRGWNFSALPERLQNDEYVFEFVDVSGFDKSKELGEVFLRSENKPDAIIIKECAAYFPGDFASYKKLLTQWISECQRAGIIPILATVVPVTRIHPLKKFVIDIIKLRNPFESGGPFHNKRQKAILEYNDWLTKYCRETRLTVLDLEHAVRKSDKNRYLRSRLAKLDGLHLNKKGYQILDQIVLPTLSKVNWEIKK